MTISVQEALSPDHLSELIVESALNPDVVKDRGYRTLYGSQSDREELSGLGFKPAQYNRDEAYPALLIPLYRATGEVIAHQLKPAAPRMLAGAEGKPRAVKYESPAGGTAHIDVPPFTQERLSDTNIGIWVTEGIKKVDSLVSQGRAAIGITGVFNWRRKLGTLGDWEDIPLKGRAVTVCFDADTSQNRNVQLAMRRFGAWLESKGARPVFYLIVPSEVDGAEVKGVDDWFAAGGDLAGLVEATSRTAPSEGPKDASFTDAVLTDTVCEDALEDAFCWSPGLGWMAWDGHVWSETADTAPTEAVRLWSIDQFQKVLVQQKTDPSRDMSGLIMGWRSVLSKGRIKALVDLSRGVLEKDVMHFDSDPDLLCVKNGYVDLRTGTLHSPDPDKLMTKSCDAEYDPKAVHPMWDKALEALPADVREWYQDRIGQAATGYMTPDDQMVIAYGGGYNGKSTLVNAIQKTLGSGPGGYGILMSDRVLMASPDAHPTELMDLRGCRYAILEETPEARRLDVHRLKKVVGTEMITARRIRQDDVTFAASHSLFVNTNFKPVVTETDHGTWRRLALLSFPYTYRHPWEPLRDEYDKRVDPMVRDPRTQRSSAFKRAVLAWVVRGACAWFERDRSMLPLPERVRLDTQNWRGETDMILGFASEMLRFTADGLTSSREMLDAFNRWGETQGHKSWTERTFASRFSAHDLIRGHRIEKRRMRLEGKDSNPVTVWVGVTVCDGGPDDPFSSHNGTEPPPDKADTKKGVQGVQGAPYNFNLGSITRVNNVACTPCTPQVRDASEPGTNSNTKTGTPAGGSEQRKEGPIVHADPAHHEADPGPVTGSEDEPHTPPGITPLLARLLNMPVPARGLPSADVEQLAAREGVTTPVSVPAPTLARGAVGFDLETRGTDWVRGGEGFIALSGYGDRVDASPEALVDRMRAGGVWVGSGIHAFDLPALERHAGLRIEETYGRVRCTQLQAMIADPPTSLETKQGPRFKSYSLDAVSQRVLGEPKDVRGMQLAAEFCTVPRCRHGRSKGCDGWEKIPVDDPRYSAYCADDVSRSMRVHAALDWTPYMEREMKVQSIMARMTLNGFRVDTELLEGRIQEGEARKAAAQLELRERFGMPVERVKVKKNGEILRIPFKSPLATEEGKSWLEGVYEKYGVKSPPRTEKTGALATGSEVLRGLADHPKCPEELRKIIDLMGMVTSERTIYRTVQDNLVGDRVHPNIWPSQASGRWSVGVGMTVMKKSERDVYLPEHDESIIAIDLNQIDARIVAVHAQDPAYLELFGPGRDLHTETAVALLGDAKYRDQAKPISHLANYGGSENKAIAMGHDPVLVRQLFEARRREFPGLIEWQNRVREQGREGELLDNGFGRPLRVEPHLAYTQAPAQVGQGGTRDMMAEGLLQLAQDAPECLPMLRAIIHDEVVLSVPTERAEEISRIVVKAFERDWAPKGSASIPVAVTAGASRPGKNWADAYGKD